MRRDANTAMARPLDWAPACLWLVAVLAGHLATATTGTTNTSRDAAVKNAPSSLGPPDSLGLSDETRLVNTLLARYKRNGKVARPVYDAKKQLIVRFGMRLIQLDIIEKEQALKASVWVRCRWRDEYLRWKPADYGGLTSVTLPWDQVWLPDIVLVNTAEAQIEERAADLMVDHSGWVFWAPHKVFKSACLIDVTNFPYDQHTCSMWFQSMSRYSWHLDLQPYLISPWDLETYLSSFKESQEWEIRENITERFTSSRDIGVMLKFSRRPALRFSLSVRRRMGYTCHLLMLPGVFLIAMTLVVFCLPPERPDRHSLAMSLFGSFMVLLLILVEVAPPTAASIPKLGTYYACNMTLVMLSIFLSGIVVNVSRRGEVKVKVPCWVKFVFIDVLAYPLLLRSRVAGVFGRPAGRMSGGYSAHDRQLETRTEASLLSSGVPAFSSAHPVSQTVYTYSPPENATVDGSGSGGGAYCSSSTCPAGRETFAQLDQKMKRMEAMVAQMHSGAQWPGGSYGGSGGGGGGGFGGEEGVEQGLRLLKVQWRNVGVVMDRLFFVLYFIVILTTLIVIFPWPSYG